MKYINYTDQPVYHQLKDIAFLNGVSVTYLKRPESFMLQTGNSTTCVTYNAGSYKIMTPKGTFMYGEFMTSSQTHVDYPTVVNYTGLVTPFRNLIVVAKRLKGIPVHIRQRGLYKGHGYYFNYRQLKVANHA